MRYSDAPDSLICHVVKLKAQVKLVTRYYIDVSPSVILHFFLIIIMHFRNAVITSRNLRLSYCQGDFALR